MLFILLQKNLAITKKNHNFAPLLKLSISIRRCFWVEMINIKSPKGLCDGRLC